MTSEGPVAPGTTGDGEHRRTHASSGGQPGPDPGFLSPGQTETNVLLGAIRRSRTPQRVHRG
ncbi:MAG: hypothetical protein M3214_03930, partial [Actinomycetota bacterium]|nr:hypothetical protein [Actinomycetota bacterium]